MTMPLIVLALLAAVAGFLGIPAVFAPNAHWLEHFLEPIFAASVAARPAVEEAGKSQEFMLMGISVAVALVPGRSGPGYPCTAVSRSSQTPTGFGKVLANKWYVDEFL